MGGSVRVAEDTGSLELNVRWEIHRHVRKTHNVI